MQDLAVTGSAQTARGGGVVRRWAPFATAAVLLTGAGWLLRRELASYNYRALSAAVRGLPTWWIARAAVLTVVCYAVLIGYDVLALRYVKRRVTWRRTALASFIAYAFSQSLGFSALTGASIRYRFWSTWGLEAGEIAQGVTFTALSFWLGVLLTGGVALLLDPIAPHAIAWLPFGLPRWMGALLLLPIVAYLGWTTRPSATLGFRGWRFRAPSFGVACAQVAVSTLDWALAGSVLLALLPATPALSPIRVVGFFVVAQVIGLLSHVPGGLGVFDTIMLVLLRPWVSTPDAVAALIAFRAVYYAFPLGVAIAMFGVYEGMRGSRVVARAMRTVGRVVPAAAPYWLSGATFAAGLILLVSSSTPSIHSRVRWLDAVVPLAVIELSHFAASVAGVILLLLANGLRRRLDAAYHTSLVVLAVGIGTSLLKGGDWEEALLLTGVLAVLWPARRHFYRRSTLWSEPLSPEWIAGVVLALGGSLAIGLFAFKHVDYSSSLWWKFAASGDAPRFLRATVGVSVVTLCYALARLFRVRSIPVAEPSPNDMARARVVARRARVAEAHLAMLGDKSLLFSESGDSFLMYGVRGRHWIAVGDPVGLPDEAAELAWRFKAMADANNGRCAFYQVGRDHLPLYIDLGLTLRKLGEEARVPLPSFRIEGIARKSLRGSIRDVEKSGARLEIVPAPQTDEMLGELRRISDEWLSHKETREKGFSLGYFEEAYLRECAAAVVRNASGRIVAFTNLWLSGEKEEVSVDLMRYASGAPKGVMDYLFLSLMMWGRDQGYAWFNLGMAPLAGLERRAMAPVWNRVAALVYAHGEHFYNFRGLREYKDKFDPVWSPRYLAASSGLSVPSTLLNVTALVSGGLRGALSR